MSGRVIHVLSGVAYDLYIGRAMPRYRLKASQWANLYRIGEDGDRDEVLRKYEDAVRHWLSVPSEAAVLKEEIAALEGLTLACWCSPRDGTPVTTADPEGCHGQILLRIAEEITRAA